MGTTAATEGIKKEIEAVLMPYLAVNSETATAGERDGEAFLLDYLGNIAYFRKHPEYFGSFPVKDDFLDRAVCWGLVKGNGTDTVVLIHHHDVVGVEDFKNLKGFAFDPQALEQELLKLASTLQPEARDDLESGEYLFGRGTADMKAGGAIQLSLLKRYSETKNWNGNILMLSLPDEENLSAGMLAAVELMTELKEKHDLNYLYAFNSEPHQRKTPEKGLFSEGSVGKVLAFVYVRGFLSHVGKVFEGLNPISVLSEIVAQTELSPFLSDHIKGESSPPPTWLYFRDRKDVYDVSMPLGAGGCISILTLNSNPVSVLGQLKEVSYRSFEEVISRMNEKYKVFCENTGRKVETLPWKPSVTTYSELLKAAVEDHGEEFLKGYQRKLAEINRKIRNRELDFMESGFLLTEFVYDYISDLSPKVILGFVPPYYPNVSNLLLDGLSKEQASLSNALSDFSVEMYGQGYEREYYYTGISDLSYFSFKEGGKIAEELGKDMPMYGKAYSVPLEKIEKLSMPCMNIGPWGKDFHKLTERVNKQDLYERTPAILNRAIQIILGNGN